MKILPSDAQMMVNDFWASQPIRSAKAYYPCRITHGYSDANCVKILKHIRDAMAEDSKLLISEMLIPVRVDEMNLTAHTMNVFMLIMRGKERTEEQFKSLLEEAGLDLTEAWRSKPGLAGPCLLEARKK